MGVPSRSGVRSRSYSFIISQLCRLASPGRRRRRRRRRPLGRWAHAAPLQPVVHRGRWVGLLAAGRPVAPTAAADHQLRDFGLPHPTTTPPPPPPCAHPPPHMHTHTVPLDARPAVNPRVRSLSTSSDDTWTSDTFQRVTAIRLLSPVGPDEPEVDRDPIGWPLVVRAAVRDAVVADHRVANRLGETVILLTLPLAFSRCFNRHREGVSAE